MRWALRRPNQWPPAGRAEHSDRSNEVPCVNCRNYILHIVTIHALATLVAGDWATRPATRCCSQSVPMRDAPATCARQVARYLGSMGRASCAARRRRWAHNEMGGILSNPIGIKEITVSTVLSEVLAANQEYATGFGSKGELALPPARGFAILTCMDARLDPAKYAGLAEGDAHVIRNAGGRASDDAIRSLVIS